MTDQPDWEMIEAEAARKAGEVAPEIGEGPQSYLIGYQAGWSEGWRQAVEWVFEFMDEQEGSDE